MPAVSNTSPVFNLACIERLNLLYEQFGDVWIPEAFVAELRQIPDDAVRKRVEQAKQAGWLNRDSRRTPADQSTDRVNWDCA